MSNEIINNSSFSNSNPTVDSLLRRVEIFIEDEEWNNAIEYSEKVLDMAPENGYAYFYEMLSSLKIKDVSEIGRLTNPIEDNKYYKKALRFSDEKLNEILKEYRYQWAISHLNSCADEEAFLFMQKKFLELDGYKESQKYSNDCLDMAQESRNEHIYKEAYADLKCDTEDSLRSAIIKFEEIKEFKDSNSLLENCKIRLDQIIVEAQEEALKKEEENKRIIQKKAQTKKKTIILISIFLVCFIIFIIIMTILHHARQNKLINQATQELALMPGKYVYEYSFEEYQAVYIYEDGSVATDMYSAVGIVKGNVESVRRDGGYVVVFRTDKRENWEVEDVIYIDVLPSGDNYLRVGSIYASKDNLNNYYPPNSSEANFVHYLNGGSKSKQKTNSNESSKDDTDKAKKCAEEYIQKTVDKKNGCSEISWIKIPSISGSKYEFSCTCTLSDGSKRNGTLTVKKQSDGSFKAEGLMFDD